jgi:hypothetical protein
MLFPLQILPTLTEVLEKAQLRNSRSNKNKLKLRRVSRDKDLTRTYKTANLKVSIQHVELSSNIIQLSDMRYVFEPDLFKVKAKVKIMSQLPNLETNLHFSCFPRRP